MKRRAVITATGSALLVGLTGFISAAPATAENGGGSPDSSGPVSQDVGGGGRQYTISITYTGDVKGAGGGSRSVRVPVPVKCWWEPASGSGAGAYKDPQAMYDWYLQRASSHSTSQYADDHLGSYQDYQEVVEQAKNGKKYYWYELECRDYKDRPEFARDSVGSETYMKAFPVVDGEPTVPVPRVDPEQVALQAYQELNLIDPVLDRNPKTTHDGHAGLTLVNIPTWFWVTDSEALGGPEGTRAIQATIEQPGGQTFTVHLTARTSGLTLSSPTETTTCSPRRAALPWKTGLDDDAGCTLYFRHPSIGYPSGYPVTATVTWNATWSTSTSPTPQPLPNGTRTITSTTDVPVAEIQTIVTNIH